MSRPLRVGYAAPNLIPNGVFHWICALAGHTDPQRIEWIGGLILGPRPIDVPCAERLSRLMPLHAVRAPNWVAWHNMQDCCQYHPQPRDAYQALAAADVVIAWELEGGLEPFFRQGIPVVLVAHSCGWAPRLPETWQLIHTAAVSRVAAAPFRAAGLEPEILHAGISLDRLSPRQGREAIRQTWRAGPGHFVTACLDRHEAEKRPRMLHRVLHHLEYQYLGVMYGADKSGRPAAWLEEEVWPNPRLQLYEPTEAVGDVYAGADLIFSGSTSEAFGQALLEGAAAGKLLVCREDLGAIPELEELSGTLIAYKFRRQDSLQSIAELVEAVAEHDRPNEGAAFLREHLAARRAAERWTAYLERLCPRRILVSESVREVKPRWRTPERPVRAVLLCRTAAELRAQVAAYPEVVWVQAVVTQADTLPGEPDRGWPPVATFRDGPPWCQRHHDLAAAFQHAARLCDVAVTRLPPAEAREYLQGSSIPQIDGAAELDQVVKPLPAPEQSRPLRVCLLCPPLGFGGTEHWILRLLQYAPAANVAWIGCCVVDAISPNRELVARLSGAGMTVLECGAQRGLAMDFLQELAPDVIVFTGLERIGQCIPAGYTGPIISVAHNSALDFWTRSWLRSSDHYTSHSVAVSYLAAAAHPEERQDDVAVIYPGIEAVVPANRDSLRRTLGFQPADRVICFAGRADANKRPDLAATAVAQLPFQYKFLHVGDVSEWTGGDYARWLQETLPDRHKLVGYSQRLDAYLAAADALVLCSQHESFGLVIMQALQAGCRVVAPSCSIVGELQCDPAWAQAPWQICDTDVPGVLASALDAVFALPLATLPIQERFSAETATWNFHQYLRSAAQTVGSMRRTQLRQLDQPRPLVKPLPAPALLCDAVLPLTNDASRNIQTARELLQQAETLVFLHAVGTAAQLADLRGALSGLRVSYHEAAPASWFQAFLACRHALLTEFVLDAHPTALSRLNRAAQALTSLVNDGLEAVLHVGDGLDVGRGCFRRQMLIDLWLTEARCDTTQVLLQLAAETGRRVGTLRSQAALLRAGCTPAPFCRGALPPRPGTQHCTAILPFRGRVAWAEAALQSLLAQESVELQIALIDDATGTDEAADFLRTAVRHPQVRAFRAKRNIGQFMAANAVVERCPDARVFLIQDGDDLSTPRRAWLTGAALQESGAEICTGSVMAFGGSMRMLSSTYPHPGSWYSVINPACGFTRGAFERLGGYCDFGQLEINKASLDTDFFMRAAARDLRFHITNHTLVHYRQHIESCTSDPNMGIGTPLRRLLEQEIVDRQLAGGLRHVRGCLGSCADLVVPVPA
jgi:glycosyltransferase involved in cell wall biosynthesis